MDALPFEPLALVAIDPARNIRRRWQVRAYHDLFGQILIETHWGRIGAKGQGKVRSFEDPASAQAYVRALLARRAGAHRRIGAAYVPLSESDKGDAKRADAARQLVYV